MECVDVSHFQPRPLREPAVIPTEDCFSAMFNTNKTLEQKLKVSMATSLHRAFIEHYIIIRP